MASPWRQCVARSLSAWEGRACFWIGSLPCSFGGAGHNPLCDSRSHKNCQARRAASRHETHFWKRKSCVTSKSLWAWPVSHTNGGGWSRDGTATDCAEVLQYRQGCVVPSNIQPATSFVQVCWDNNDLLEETLTGIGTTHCTNGIAMQRQVQLAMPQTQSVPMQPTSKGRRRRSIVILPEVNLEYVGWGSSGSNPFSHSDLRFSSPVKY